jgi:hypothetical protein
MTVSLATPFERPKAKHEPFSKKYETNGERSGVVVE